VCVCVCVCARACVCMCVKYIGVIYRYRYNMFRLLSILWIRWKSSDHLANILKKYELCQRVLSREVATFSRKSDFATLVKFFAECPELAVRAVPTCLLSDCYFF